MLEGLKNFKSLIGISALLVAGCAAFFSVYGLSKLFSGAALSVVIMAGALEFTKLVAASFIYQNWYTMGKSLRAYLSAGVVTLVLITSAGIYGYLSNAYQGATVGFEKQTSELLALEDRLEQMQDERKFLQQSLDAQMESLPSNYITAKRTLLDEYTPQLTEASNNILKVKSRISDLELELIETGVDVGPAVYLARSFDTDIDTVVKFFIFILIFVFDPMALAMVIAWNTALGRAPVKPEPEPEPEITQSEKEILYEKIDLLTTRLEEQENLMEDLEDRWDEPDDDIDYVEDDGEPEDDIYEQDDYGKDEPDDYAYEDGDDDMYEDEDLPDEFGYLTNDSNESTDKDDEDVNEEKTKIESVPRTVGRGGRKPQ